MKVSDYIKGLVTILSENGDVEIENVYNEKDAVCAETENGTLYGY